MVDGAVISNARALPHFRHFYDAPTSTRAYFVIFLAAGVRVRAVHGERAAAARDAKEHGDETRGVLPHHLPLQRASIRSTRWRVVWAGSLGRRDGPCELVGQAALVQDVWADVIGCWVLRWGQLQIKIDCWISVSRDSQFL